MTTMAEPPAHGALDVRTFLLGDADPEALRDRIGAALDASEHRGPLQAFRGAARRALDEELAEAAVGFLDVDVGATAVAGWRKHDELVAAARATRASPDETQRVELARHTMTSTWKPRIEVHLGPARLAHLSFELTVAFTLVGLSAVVRDARLVRLAGGSGTLSAKLCLAGQALAERTAPFDACASVSLGPGVPLLQPGETEHAPSVIELPDADAGADADTTVIELPDVAPRGAASSPSQT